MLKETGKAIEKLKWMRKRRIWPNGLRYLWTDAFGVALLVSLYRETGEKRFLDEAEWVVGEVYRVLGRERGLRIGEEPDRDGQYFHYLAMWMFALGKLGEIKPHYRETAIALAAEIHPAFVIPGAGVIWKMKEDLSAPYAGSGFGGIDHFHGYVVMSQLDRKRLASEIAEMKDLVDQSFRTTAVTQDLGQGMLLWMTHFYPEEPWAKVQKERCLATLQRMWVDPPGYFCREPYLRHVKFAFTNYGVSVGLQSIDAMGEEVQKLNTYFADYISGDEYDTNAITHVMACNSYFPGCLI